MLLGAGCGRAPTASPSSAGEEGEALTSVPALAPPPPQKQQLRGVYGSLAGPPDPLAAELCAALHDLPAQRRAACCAAPGGIVITGECTRVVSAALRAGAVRLDAGAVAACRAALARSLDGCDWVGAFNVTLPPACAGLLHGTLTAGAVCRSSLECAGDLRCRGAGPTQPGHCGPPLAAGAACGLATDTLAVYTRADDVERAHPECAGYCERHRCHDAIAPGGACTLTSQCADGAHCRAGRCAPGRWASDGESCTGGDCAPGSRCVANRCLAPRTSGACTSDFECRGGCVAGQCGPRCDRR
jgi:hypothetical protein